jgi:hypothetical protein
VRRKRKQAPGIERRLMVRAPGDIWSEEFRTELRHDRAFEGSLLAREAAVLAIVAVLIVLHLILA